MESRQRFCIKKFSVGVASVCIGLWFLQGQVSAEGLTPATTSASPVLTELVTQPTASPSADLTTEAVTETSSQSSEPVGEIAPNQTEPVTETVTEAVTSSQPREETTSAAQPSVSEEVPVTVAAGEERAVAETAPVAASVADVKATLSAVTYDSTEVYTSLNPRVRALEKIAIQNELKKELGQAPTDAQVQERVQKVYLDKLDLSSAFEAAKANLDTSLGQLLGSGNAQLETQLRNSATQAMIGLAYLEKYYGFNLPTGQKAKDVILTKPTAVNALIRLGSSGYTELGAAQTYQTYQRRLAGTTGQASLTDFLEANMAGKNVNDWFVETSKAVIVEQAGTDTPYDYRLYNKLKTNTSLQPHILPLLAQSSPSLYAISTTGSLQYGMIDTYVAKPETGFTAVDIAKAKTLMTQTAKGQAAYLDTWYRIAKDNVKEKLKGPLLVIDTMQLFGDGAGSTRWAPETGTKAPVAVKEFISPLGMYNQYLFAEGYAEVAAKRVVYILSEGLEEDGLVTYSHEITHILDKEVWFGGADRRDGLNVEVFARGLFENINNSQKTGTDYPPVFNLNFAFDLTNEAKRTQNATGSRFQTADDLKTYMSGVFDVLYTLDYAEADVALEKAPADKALWFNKLTAVVAGNNDPNRNLHVDDSFANITATDAERLTSVDDLIDQDMVASRYVYSGNKTTGTATGTQAASYYVIPLFEPIYAAMQNSSGVTGDVSVRRQAYELLAEYGYYGGMVPYLSNELKAQAAAENKIFSDDYVLGKILTEHNGDFASFKKAMFQRRIEKTDHLKPVTIQLGNDTITISNYDQLKALMTDAVNADLEQLKKNKVNNQNVIGVTKVRELKEAIYRAYLTDTNDFRASIYLSPVTTREESLPFNTIYQADGTLTARESREIQAGQTGLVLIKEQDGQEISREILTDKTDRLIKVGTKTKVVVTELPFAVTEVADDNLLAGVRETQTPGQAGSLTVTTTYTLDTVTGVVSEQSRELRIPPVNQVVRVGRKQVSSRTETVPFTTNYRANAEKDYGYRATVTEGRAGQVTITVTNGQESRQVTLEPVAQVIEVGTKTKVETRALAYSMVEVFDNQLAKTERILVQEGREGQETVTTTYNLDSQTGQVTSISQTSRTEPTTALYRTGYYDSRFLSDKDNLPSVSAKPTALLIYEPIAFAISYVYDSNLAKGEQVIDVPGQAGQRELITVDGQVVSDQITLEPVIQIVRTGDYESEIPKSAPSVSDKPTALLTYEPIAFAISYIYDSNLAKGEEVIDVAGVVGQRELITVDGQVVSDQIILEPVTQIVRTGDYESDIPKSAPSVSDKPTALLTYEPLAFAISYVYDSSLAKGEQVIDVPGQAGQRELITVGGQVISDQIILEPVTQVIRVGSKGTSTQVLQLKDQSRNAPQPLSAKPETKASPTSTSTTPSLPKTGEKGNLTAYGLASMALALLGLNWKKRKSKL